jgi:outer membrane protein assembly factor BamA
VVKEIVLLILILLSTPPVPAVRAEALTLLSIVFEGNRAVGSNILQSKLRHSRPGTSYEPEILRFELMAIERYYEDEGFLRAAIGPPVVDVSEAPGLGKAVTVHIPISEGPRYTLGSLEIRNASALSPETLQQMCPVRSGQPYGRRKIQAWMDKIMSAYHELGYLRAETKLQEDIDEMAQSVRCVLDCSEGAVYRVRRVTITNLEGREAQEFRRRLLVGEGLVYNPEMLVMSLQLLNSMRIYGPMSEENVKVTIDDNSGSVDLEFSPVRLPRAGQSLED